MTDEAPPFPEIAFAGAARFYARAHDLRRLARQLGVEKRGHRIGKLSEAEVVGLLARKAAESPEARTRALRIMRRALGNDVETQGRGLDELRGEIVDLESPGQGERAAWILALLDDPRPEAWTLVELVEPGSSATVGEAITDELTGNLDKLRKRLTETRKEKDRLGREARALAAEAGRRSGEVESQRRETAQLREELAAEVKRRILAERALDRVAATSKSKRNEARAARDEVSRLQQALQVREGGLSQRERKDLLDEIEALKEKHETLNRDYAALKGTLRSLEERLEDAWGSGEIEEKDLKPRHPGESLIVEPPLEKDESDPADKVRLPTAPHHWPGGEERFVRFLERLGRDPYVKRIVPRRFQHPTDHGIRFVTDRGNLMVRVSEGDHASQVLVITTATHRGQGEYVRHRLEEVFGRFSL